MRNQRLIQSHQSAVHQAASSVINKDEQAAFRRTSFKPVMRGNHQSEQVLRGSHAGIWVDEHVAYDASMGPRVHQPSSIF